MNVVVAGIGMTQFGRWPGRSMRELTNESVLQAIDDADITSQDIDTVFFSNGTQAAFDGQFMVRGQMALRDLSLNASIFNVDNACAGGASALALGTNSILSGQADVVLCVGTEKLWSPDKQKAAYALAGAADVSQDDVTPVLRQAHEDLGIDNEMSLPAADESLFMHTYAAGAKRHMAKFGLTQEELAAVAAKNRTAGVFNPKAQFRRETSVEDVLDSPSIVWPLTLLMCSPVSDGSASCILMSESKARQCGSIGRAVRVRSSYVFSGNRRDNDDLSTYVSARAASRAYELAGIGPDEVNVAEVHDATAFGEVLQTECLSFCAPGEGGKFASSGASSLGGRLPVNPSGGLESKGHPIGASGLAQICELVSQLRDEAGERQVKAARVAVAENGGGFIAGQEAVAAVSVLSAD